MTALQIKNQLHKLVVETDDVNILNQVESYFLELVSKNDWWDLISDENKKAIEQSSKEVAEGKGIPYEDVRKTVLKRINDYKNK